MPSSWSRGLRLRSGPVREPPGAPRRTSEVRREPHGDPGAGVVGVGGPDSQPSVARASEVRREPHGDPGAGVVGVGGPDSPPSVARASEVRREPHGDPGAGVAGAGRPDSQPSVARASEVRPEPHGDPGAGVVGVGGPDSQPLLARESKLPCPPAAGCRKFRLVVTDCERGAGLPFTLSPRPRRRRIFGSPSFPWPGQVCAACTGAPVFRPASRPKAAKLTRQSRPLPGPGRGPRNPHPDGHRRCSVPRYPRFSFGRARITRGREWWPRSC